MFHLRLALGLPRLCKPGFWVIRDAFKCKVEGNKWYHTGQTGSGQTLEEVWERVEKK